MKKIISIMLSCIILGTIVGCNGNNSKKDDDEQNEDTIIQDNEKADELDNNYVYCWNKSGVGGSDKILKIQTSEYALTSNAKSGAIEKIGAYHSVVSNKYSRADFDKLLTIKSMKYNIKSDNQENVFNRHNGYHRVIESGRFVQRIDYNSLVNLRERLWTGRIEITAQLPYFALNFEAHNGHDTEKTADMELTMEFSENMEYVTSDDGRYLTLKNNSGQGFTIVKTKGDNDTSFEFKNNILTIIHSNITIKTGEYGGFGVFVIPRKNAKLSDANVIKNIENCVVTAKNFDTNEELPVEYDKRRGVFNVDISSVGSMTTQSTKAGRNTYDRVLFEINNNSGSDVKVPVSFKKTRNISVTGMSPMIRDAVTEEPTGIQVQISKNWHTNPNTDIVQSDPSRYMEGTWFSGTTSIEVNSSETARYEYTCAYGEYGGVYSASHGQLCLIGWGGANNILWEESALGSWGESITYDPDMGLERSMIDDVRPFLVTSGQGGNQKYNWTGNVGGANFLDYYPKAKQSRIVDLIPVYHAQAPCMTDVEYMGITSDEAIKTNIKINMGRTDDVVRTYYTIRYEFLKDVQPERLSFFKVCADGYADNYFRKYAIGDASGIVKNDVPAFGVQSGYNGQAEQAKNKDFWFTLYDSSDKELENGDVSFIVRDYNAVINGKCYDKPSYRIFGTSNVRKQPSCELSLPPDVSSVKAGSRVEIKIEYLVLPAVQKDYYGTSDYLLESHLFGTSEATFNQVNSGRIVVNSSIGEVKDNYPVKIQAEEGEVVAQFSLKGGLGYIPVVISNVNDFSGYKLQKKVSESWQDIVQTGSTENKNDFWQVIKNNSDKFDFVYNIKNTEGINYGIENEYRLIKVQI